MPSVSGKQHRFMAAVANNPKFAKKAGVPQSGGEEFLKADKGRKFAGGGEMESKKMVGKEIAFMKKKGAPKSMIKHEMSEMKGMKKMAMGGDVNKPSPITTQTQMGSSVPGSAAGMTRPSMPKISTDEAPMKSAPVRRMPPPSPVRGTQRAFAGGGLAAGHKQADGVAQRGKTRGMEVKMAAGGLAAGHKQADGCAQRGKTRGMQVKMANGGKC